MPPAARVPLLLVLLAAFAWPAMMGLHELGHVIGAWAGGGTVRRVVWHPLFFSRTDVQPDPRPLLTVWAGPVVGVVLPLLADGVAAWRARPSAYLFGLFAGFCCLANGAYIGLGVLDPLGDTEVMLRRGTPAVALVVFGLAAAAAGLWRWHRVSPRLKDREESNPTRHLLAVAAAAGAVLGASAGWSMLG